MIYETLRDKALIAAERGDRKAAERRLHAIDTAIEEQRTGAINALKTRLGVTTDAWEWRRGKQRSDGYPVPLYDWHATVDDIEFVWTTPGISRFLKVVRTCPDCGKRSKHKKDIRNLVDLGLVLRDIESHECDCVEEIHQAIQNADITAHLSAREEADARFFLATAGYTEYPDHTLRDIQNRDAS